jgi:uncharacterized protein (DUF2267 family)
MTSSVPVFDTTLHKSNEWINEVAGELHTSDRQHAYRVLRGVLHALRDRLTPEEAVHLGAQLPMLLRGSYYEGWQPHGTPMSDGRETFFARMQESLADQPGVPDPERWARAVFLVLARRVDIGEVRDVMGILPRDLAALWPNVAGGNG